MDDEEVTGETHHLDDVQLEIDPLYDFRRRLFAPTILHALIYERGEVVRLELDPQNLVISAKTIIAIRSVPGVELLSKRRFVKPLCVVINRAEFLRNREFNDIRCFAYLVIFDSLCNLDRVLDPFWMLREPNGHLFSRHQVFSPIAMSAVGISQFPVVEDGAIGVKRLGLIFFDEPHRICRADHD